MSISKYIILLMAVIVTTTACKKEFSFNTNSVDVLEVTKEFTAADLGLTEGETFNPVAVRSMGDTLMVANNGAGFYGVVILKKSTGEIIKKLSEWDFNNSIEKFDNQIMDVCLGSDKLFVVNRSSRIDVFNIKNFSYITTIGKTGWQSSSLLQCESADVAGKQLFIRDKHKIVVVNLDDCTPANRFKVPNFIATSDSTSQNNGFNLQHVVSHKGKVYISDYEKSRILVVDPKSASEKNGKLSYGKSIITKNKPLSFSFCGNDIFIVCANNTIEQIDLKSGKSIGTVSSFATAKNWINPGNLLFDGDEFYLNSRNTTTAFMKKGVLSSIEITTVK